MGDPEFDAAVRIRASDEIAAKLLFDRGEIKRAFLEAIKLHPGIEADETRVHFERTGVLSDPVKLRALLDLLAPIARAMGG